MAANWKPSIEEEPPLEMMALLNIEEEADDIGYLDEEVDEDVELEEGTAIISYTVGADGALIPDSDDEETGLSSLEAPVAAGDAPMAGGSAVSRGGTGHALSDDDEVERVAPPLPGVAGGGRGRGRGAPAWRVPARGRRGRGGRGGRGGMHGVVGAWSRSDPLIERFADDELIPAQLREEIERIDSRRVRASRVRRVANPANVEEDSGDDYDEVGEGNANDMYENEEFVWEPVSDYSATKETFLPQNAGPTCSVRNPYDAFRAFWDDSLLSHIVTESNIYALGIESESFQRSWYNTNIDELMVLFAFWMMLAIIRMPSIKSCFSMIPLMQTEAFRRMFTEKRYWNLNRAFNLARGLRDMNDPNNVLYPMGPVLDELNNKFKQNYNLHQDICIDESLTLWKGQVKFKQFIRTKAARFGIKTYQLCESTTGYLWSFFIYIGRRTTTSTLPPSIAYVVTLVEPLLDLGHVLFMDNWFNSPTLARYLKRRRTDCVGTLRPIRKHVPAVVQRAPLVDGEFVARRSGDVMVLALQDRKRVTVISTCHSVDQVQKAYRPGRPSHYKLQLIEDYNQRMGGVDRLDQMLEPYLVERKQCLKWTKKMFKRLLNITIQNARILLEQSSNNSWDSLTFRLALVKSILDRHQPNIPVARLAQPSQRFPDFPAGRLTGRHFICRIPITEAMRATVRHAQNLGRRQCVWCSATVHRKKATAYECPECNVALCLDSCFKSFHTIP